MTSANVAYWHISEVPIRAINVRSSGKPGQHMLAPSLTGLTLLRHWSLVQQD
jgi:hypothetical protein